MIYKSLGLLSLSLSLGAHSLYSVNLLNPDLENSNQNNLLRSFTEIAADLSTRVQNYKEAHEREKQREIENATYKLQHAQDNQEKELWRNELEQLLQSKNQNEQSSHRLHENSSQAVLNITTGIFQAAIDSEKERCTAEHELNKTAAQAHINAKAHSKTQLASLDKKLAFWSNPKTIQLFAVGASATALGIYGAKHGSQLIADMLRHYYRNPSIAQETSLLSLMEKLQNSLWGARIRPSNIRDVILEKTVAERINLLSQSIKNTVNNGGYFQNILLYGPPGTGKTMIAQRLARSCNLEYIYFAASSLLQLSTEEALIKITELFEFPKNSGKKLMIIIDEAEKLFAHRKDNLDNKVRNLLTQILTYTGTESQDYLIVSLTNLPQELDPAFLSRCDEQIQINPPSLKERKNIITKYIQEYLLTPLVKERKKTTFLSNAINYFKKPIAPIKLNIEPGALSQTVIDTLAQKTDGFVGRDIAKMILAIQARAYASSDRKITFRIISQILERKIDQHKELHTEFNRHYSSI